MGALIFAYCFAGLLAALPLLASGRMERQVAAADEQRLKDFRRLRGAVWLDYLIAAWCLTTLVGAVFSVVRGHSIGWAWLGVAALYAAAIVLNRRSRRRVLAAIGDRGQGERPASLEQRTAMSHRFAAIGVIGYVGEHTVDYAYRHDLSPLAEVANAAFVLALVVGVGGFLIIRLRMYLSGDDLPTARA
jgi:hypothetical protein